MLFLGTLYKNLIETRPLTDDLKAREPDHRGVVIGFSIFGAVCAVAYVLLFTLGMLLAIASYHSGGIMQPWSPMQP